MELIEENPALVVSLEPFCSDEREYLEKPFLQDGYVYATNGRIAVRVKHEGLTNARVQTRPNMAEIFKSFVNEGFEPVTFTLPDCEICHNKRTVIDTKCYTCDGFGRIEHDCDCQYCTKDREFCDDCKGTGKVDPEECLCECSEHGKSVSLGFCSVRVDVAQLLHDIPGLTLARKQGVPIVSFRGSNGMEGIFMPLQKDD